MSDEDENVTPAAPAKKSKILPLILILNTLLVVGVLIFVLKRPAAQAAPSDKDHAGGESHAAPAKGGDGHAAKGGEQAEAAPGTEGLGPTIRLDAFIVQVRTTEGDRYAHMTIEIEVAAEADKRAIEVRMSRIRDMIIAHLSDRTEDELRGSEGLGQLKESLLKKVGEIVPGRRARGLFITEFMMQ